MEGVIIEQDEVKVLRGRLLVQDGFVIRRVMGLYFSLPAAKGRMGMWDEGFNPSSRTRPARD